jgi:hypothetical protein
MNSESENIRLTAQMGEPGESSVVFPLSTGLTVFPLSIGLLVFCASAIARLAVRIRIRAPRLIRVRTH